MAAAIAALAVGVLSPAVAVGQGTAVSPLAGDWEVGVAASWLGAIPLGSASANLTTPAGGALPLFATASRFASGLGVEVEIARALSRRIHVAGVATWMRTSIETDVTDDAEDVADVRLTNHTSRVSAEGSVSIALATWPRQSVYATAGGGWMRELPGGVLFGANGGVGKVGAGVKYWWRRRQPGQARPGRERSIGLRVEARAVARSHGVSFGASRARVAPGLLAGLIFGL